MIKAVNVRISTSALFVPRQSIRYTVDSISKPSQNASSSRLSASWVCVPLQVGLGQQSTEQHRDRLNDTHQVMEVIRDELRCPIAAVAIEHSVQARQRPASALRGEI